MREVVELERQIWGPGYDEVVPVPILAVSVHRGGILIGAFDGDRMIGFVYSLPGIKDGKADAVVAHGGRARRATAAPGSGETLKVLQRDRTLAMGLDLIEWTYDPLQAMNAHLNFAKLGVIAEEYAENIYGTSSSPLHQGNPTDRFVAEWWIRTPHVERRLARRRSADAADERGRRRAAGQSDARQRASGSSRSTSICRSTRGGCCVEIPMGFTEMLSRAPELALAWRICTRAIFTTYFDRGYRAVDFFLDREARKGAYLLTRGIKNYSIQQPEFASLSGEP